MLAILGHWDPHNVTSAMSNIRLTVEGKAPMATSPQLEGATLNIVGLTRTTISGIRFNVIGGT